MPETRKVLQVYIPVVVSDVVQSNGLTPYIDFFIERMYLASNLNTFTKFTSLNIMSSKFVITATAILGAIATGVKVYKDILDIKHKKAQQKKEDTNFLETVNLTEDIKLVMDKPTQIVIQDTLIIFRAMNFISDKDIHAFRLRADQTKSIWSRLISKFFRTHVSIVTNDVFYCYSAEEVSDQDIKAKLQDKYANVVVVDTINDLVTAYVKVKGTTTVNSVKLTKLINDKKSLHGEVSVDQVLKSLKAIRTSKF